ncbi:MAG: hypothetical protein IPF38_18835 [Burkholderiales bacterium]|nr:hypothetical protein [Burkholderiales bacterium]
MESQLPAVRKKILIASTNADLAGAPIHVLTLVTALQTSFDFSLFLEKTGRFGKRFWQKEFQARFCPHSEAASTQFGIFAVLWLS